jgi:hypothetical protein
MPFEINTSNSKVFNQFTNGQGFTLATGSFDSSFTANVEKVRVQTDFEFTWYAQSGAGTWQVAADNILSSNTNFMSEGFAIGQVFEFYENFATRFNTAAAFTGQILDFLNNGQVFTFSVLSGTVPVGSLSNCGIWAIAGNLANKQDAILVSFGLPEISESDSFESKLDNSLQRYESININDVGVTNLIIGTTTKSPYSGQMEIERKTEIGKNAVAYTLRHDLVVLPYYLEGDPDVILNPPNGSFRNVVSNLIDRFAGSNCLRYIAEIELRNVYTNPQNRKTTISLNGNTGWFMDNFNSGAFKFEQATDIIYNLGNTNGLVFGQVNDIEFTIKSSVNTTVAAGARFAVYTSLLPPSERYENTLTNFTQNFAYDCAVNTAGSAAVNGENAIITNCVGTLITVGSETHLRVTAKINYNSSSAQNTDNYVIWTGIESGDPAPSPPVIQNLPCNTTIGSISTNGVREWQVNLQSGGGVLNLDIDSMTDVVKMEILHNGIKVATTGMTAVNGGPFDADNGTANAPAADQYINTSKGAIPNRSAAFLSENGFSQAVLFQQLVWFNYDAADFAANPIAIVRLTKTGGNYRFIRHCPT